MGRMLRRCAYRKTFTPEFLIVFPMRMRHLLLPGPLGFRVSGRVIDIGDRFLFSRRE